jgi:hypothetical protein
MSLADFATCLTVSTARAAMVFCWGGLGALPPDAALLAGAAGAADWSAEVAGCDGAGEGDEFGVAALCTGGAVSARTAPSGTVPASASTSATVAQKGRRMPGNVINQKP